MSAQITEQKYKSRRIASNSLLLFVRMLAIMAINLYAVRLLLRALGQDDYGTFNAVAGVVLAGSFITTTLAVSIQRYYSYALGEGRKDQLAQIFSASVNIILALTIVALLLFETLGLWFVNTGLPIPSDRVVAANWVFQFSVFTLCAGFLQLPYTAAIFAHEEMGLFALISLAECLLRLVVVLLIGTGGIDGLVFYGAGLFAVSLVVFSAYVFFVRRRYAVYHYHRRVDRSIYKSLLSFSGWIMYSAIAGIGLTQGITILLYMFFGPVITAAYAISMQVLHAFQSVGNSIVVAFRPAMVKSYAEKNYAFLDQMFAANNKLILYVMAVVAIPLIFELRTIFGWWLGDVSEESVTFTRLIIVYVVCLHMHNPITTIVQSTGRVKYYSLFVESVMLACVPATWVAFRLGASSEMGVVLMIAVCLLAHAVRLLILRRLYPPFRLSSYLRDVVLRGILVLSCCAVLVGLVHSSMDPGLVRLMAVTLTSVFSMVLAVYFLGLSKDEQQKLRHFVMKRLKFRE